MPERITDLPLVTCTRLRRERPVQVVLVHGLFSNAAFWLPHLEQLGDFQLTLLGIDYAAVLSGGVALDVLARQAERLVGPAPAHLVAHSFGAIVGLHFTRQWRSRTLLCPTFAAASIDGAGFCAAIAARIGIDPAAAAPLVAQAIARKAAPLPAPRWRAPDLVCLPVDDPYFDYAPPPGVACRRYRGGHFDLGAPMAGLARRLNKYA